MPWESLNLVAGAGHGAGLMRPLALSTTVVMEARGRLSQHKKESVVRKAELEAQGNTQSVGQGKL